MALHPLYWSQHETVRRVDIRTLTAYLGWLIGEPMRSHWRANLPLLLPVALLLTLTPLAYANPPDPARVLGFWNDKDFDDVVGYITSAAALLQASITCEHRVP